MGNSPFRFARFVPSETLFGFSKALRPDGPVPCVGFLHPRLLLREEDPGRRTVPRPVHPVELASGAHALAQDRTRDREPFAERHADLEVGNRDRMLTECSRRVHQLPFRPHRAA